MMNANQIAVKANDIFVLSDSFLRIKALIDDESSTIDDIAQVIMADPGLAGAVLKLANSSLFNYPRKIDTLSKAVLVLGITEIYNLVIAKCTTDAFKQLNASSDYLDKFWQQSVSTALIIKYLGGQLRAANAERMFVLGLLHNLGELVVKQFYPEHIEQLQPQPKQVLPWHKQQSVLGFTFADCTAELLKCWQLPFSIVEPIRHQDNEQVGQLNLDVQLLYLAKRIMLKENYYPRELLADIVDTELLTKLDFSETQIRQAVSFAKLESLSILAILKAS